MAEPDDTARVSEYHDEYSESIESDFRSLEGALLDEPVSRLAHSEPIRLSPDATVGAAVDRMVALGRSAVVIVDGAGRLIGLFTDRDALARVAAARRQPDRTRLGDVMTPAPEALRPDDRLCHAVNRMTSLGCRTIPVVDDAGRPVGTLTVNDIVLWLAESFPDAVLRLRPGDRLRRPGRVDAG